MDSSEREEAGTTNDRDAWLKPFRAPTISMPKGGGAIRGLGEKFAANPVTGTGSMTVPIATSPGRAGFGPRLSLSYDSGAGNGPFGFGWTLSLPTITRKTEKGLPRYRDADDSDIFILAGSEDLVPVFREKPPPHIEDRWVRDLSGNPIIGRRLASRWRRGVPGPPISPAHRRTVRAHRTLDEFHESADVFWRSISRDNITTWYGRTDESPSFDPVAPRAISLAHLPGYDDKGNAIV
jgi:hypothetical protein